MNRLAATPSTHGTVKKVPGTAGLPVTDVTCFRTEARCLSIAAAIAERAGSGTAGAGDWVTAWAHTAPLNAPIAKIHLIPIFYRQCTRNSE